MPQPTGLPGSLQPITLAMTSLSKVGARGEEQASQSALDSLDRALGQVMRGETWPADRGKARPLKRGNYCRACNSWHCDYVHETTMPGRYAKGF